VARGGRQQLVRAGVGGLAAGGRSGLGVFGGFGGIGEVEFVWTRRRTATPWLTVFRPSAAGQQHRDAAGPKLIGTASFGLIF
jgi:hypothetical protein